MPSVVLEHRYPHEARLGLTDALPEPMEVYPFQLTAVPALRERPTAPGIYSSLSCAWPFLALCGYGLGLAVAGGERWAWSVAALAIAFLGLGLLLSGLAKPAPKLQYAAIGMLATAIFLLCGSWGLWRGAAMGGKLPLESAKLQLPWPLCAGCSYYARHAGVTLEGELISAPLLTASGSAYLKLRVHHWLRPSKSKPAAGDCRSNEACLVCRSGLEDNRRLAVPEFTTLVKLRGEQWGKDGDYLPRCGQAWSFTGVLQSLAYQAHPRALGRNARYWRAGITTQMLAEEGHCLTESAATPSFLLSSGWEQSLELISDFTRAGQSFYERHLALLPQREQALVLGIVTGSSHRLAEESSRAFQTTGTSHFLAASGLNVGLLVAIVYALGRGLGLPRNLRLLLSIGLTFFYAALVGFTPSIVRATLMAWMVCLALLLGRSLSPGRSLLLVSLVVLVVQPEWLVSPAWQLSCGAVLGIIVFFPVFNGWGERVLALKLLRQSISMTLAIMLTVSPIVVWHFQQLAVISLPANLLLAPLIEALLPLGLVAAPLHAWLQALNGSFPANACPFVLSGLGLLVQLVFHVVYCLATIALDCVMWLAELSGPIALPRPNWTSLVAYYAGVFALRACCEINWTKLMHSVKAKRAVRRLAWSVSALACIGCLLGLFVFLGCYSGKNRNNPEQERLTIRLWAERAGYAAWVSCRVEPSWSERHYLVYFAPAATRAQGPEPMEEYVARGRQMLLLYGVKDFKLLVLAHNGLYRYSSTDKALKDEAKGVSWQLEAGYLKLTWKHFSCLWALPAARGLGARELPPASMVIMGTPGAGQTWALLAPTSHSLVLRPAKDGRSQAMLVKVQKQGLEVQGEPWLE